MLIFIVVSIDALNPNYLVALTLQLLQLLNSYDMRIFCFSNDYVVRKAKIHNNVL